MKDQIWTTAVTARFDGGTETVREARRFLREVLDEGDAGWADDVLLLASELATNAVIHAKTAYTVTVRRDDDRIRIEVADGSPVSARRCRYSPTSGTGRGLGMIEDVAAAWGIEGAPSAGGGSGAGGGGKVVWFELRVSEQAGGDDRRPRLRAVPNGDEPPDLDALLSELGGGDGDEADAGGARDQVVGRAA